MVPQLNRKKYSEKCAQYNFYIIRHVNKAFLSFVCSRMPHPVKVFPCHAITSVLEGVIA